MHNFFYFAYVLIIYIIRLLLLSNGDVLTSSWSFVDARTWALEIYIKIVEDIESNIQNIKTSRINDPII